MVIALVKGAHNAYQFKTLLDIFYSDNNFYDLAESMIAVYRILMNKEAIIKNIILKIYLHVYANKIFFTRREVTALSKRGNKVRDIIEILKGKELDYFKIFSLSLN